MLKSTRMTQSSHRRSLPLKPPGTGRLSVPQTSGGLSENLSNGKKQSARTDFDGATCQIGAILAAALPWDALHDFPSRQRARLMDDISFELALAGRVEDMLDACTRCGKCVEVCPSVQPAGLSATRPEDIIGGVLDLVRTGDGPEASRKWAASCMFSGECIESVRLRCQSTLPACHGASRHGEGCEPVA